MYFINWDPANPNETGLFIASGTSHTQAIWAIAQAIVNASGSLWEIVTGSTPDIGGTFASTISAATDNNTAGLHVTLAYTPDNGDYTAGRLMRLMNIGAGTGITVEIIDLQTAGGIAAAATKWCMLYSNSGSTSFDEVTHRVIKTIDGVAGNIVADMRIQITMADDWICFRARRHAIDTDYGQGFIFLKDSFSNDHVTRDELPGIFACSFNGTTANYGGVYTPGRVSQYNGSQGSALTASTTSFTWGRLSPEIAAIPFVDLPDAGGEMVCRAHFVFTGYTHAELVGYGGVIPGLRMVRSTLISIAATLTLGTVDYFLLRAHNDAPFETEAEDWGFLIPVTDPAA